MPNQGQEIYFVTIIGIILGLLLVGFIVITLYLYQRRQQRQEQEMEKMKDTYEKEELRSQLEIQENTFKTIAQELHDNIGQMLSVVKLSLSALPIEKTHTAYEQVQNSQQMLNKAIYDLSNLTKSLHTDRIAQVGLSDSIRFELYGIKKAGIMEVQFHQQGTEMELDDQKSIFLFRIFQESLNNILKHAKATEVIVNLSYLDNIFVLEIKDNGVGFNLTEKQQSTKSSSGVGLKSIFNRAKLIGADISIDSKADSGTTILIELPLLDE
jgi:two-component system, NarL family, sensor kinase